MSKDPPSSGPGFVDTYEADLDRASALYAVDPQTRARRIRESGKAYAAHGRGPTRREDQSRSSRTMRAETTRSGRPVEQSPPAPTPPGPTNAPARQRLPL